MSVMVDSAPSQVHQVSMKHLPDALRCRRRLVPRSRLEADAKYESRPVQDGHDLLDALLASCQKSALNSPLPSFGRELRPYFEDGPAVLNKGLPKR